MKATEKTRRRRDKSEATKGERRRDDKGRRQRRERNDGEDDDGRRQRRSDTGGDDDGDDAWGRNKAARIDVDRRVTRALHRCHKRNTKYKQSKSMIQHRQTP